MQSFGKKIPSAALSLVLLAGAYPASVFADNTSAAADNAARLAVFFCLRSGQTHTFQNAKSAQKFTF